MEGSDKEQEGGASANPEEQIIFIKAHLILEGSPDNIEHAITQEVEVPDLIHKQESNPIFAQFFDSVKELNAKDKEGEQRSIWVDVRSAKVKAKETGVTLALFIAYYGSGKGSEIARAFQRYNEFKKFRPVIESIGLDKKIDMEKLKEEV